MTQYRPPILSTIPPVVKNLILINILMMVATWAMKGLGISLTMKLGLFYPGSEYFRPYQFVTHMFMHGGLAHLFFNMFALYMFGRILESVWGPKRFLFYYLVTGLGAAALHSFVNYLELSSLQQSVNAFINTPSPELFVKFVKDNPEIMRSWSGVGQLMDKFSDQPDNPALINQSVELVKWLLKARMNIPTIGASGAVFGILLAFGVLFPNTQLMLLFPPIPIKAKYVVIFYGGLELYLGLTQPGSNIAHFAHLGGMIFGFILIKYWNKNSKRFY